MWKEEYLDVLIPCFYALWLLCSCIAVGIYAMRITNLREEDDEHPHDVFVGIMMFILGPVALGLIFSHFALEVSKMHAGQKTVTEAVEELEELFLQYIKDNAKTPPQ